MAKKSAIQKNLNKEKQVKKNKSRRERLKSICNNRSLSMEQRFEANSNCLKCQETAQKLD